MLVDSVKSRFVTQLLCLFHQHPHHDLMIGTVAEHVGALEACGLAPYTGSELRDLQNRFFAASQTFQHFQLETQFQKAFLIRGQNIFGQKKLKAMKQ